MHHLQSAIQLLESIADENRIEGMKRFAISSPNMLGVSMPNIRKIANQIGQNHAVAIQLWHTQIHEARILATIIADPMQTTAKLMEEWIHDFATWDICDQCCCNLFKKLPELSNQKIHQYYNADAEFVKRFAFAMIAVAAVHWKKTDDIFFIPFFPMIISQATDNRNFVRKAINWALRQLGKRSAFLHAKALACCDELYLLHNSTANWIATDAVKELESDAVRKKLGV
jgi:3-methyladenine DNA glycosylase AlkD